MLACLSIFIFIFFERCEHEHVSLAQVQLYVRHLLPAGESLLYWVPALLQAGHSAVLRRQTAHGRHHCHPAGLRQIQGWRLQVSAANW